MNPRIMAIFKAARTMMQAGKDLTKKGAPEMAVLKDKAGIGDITPKERDEAARMVENVGDNEVLSEEAGPRRESYRITIPNMRPINHQRLRGRLKGVFSEEEATVSVMEHGTGHFQIDLGPEADPALVHETLISVLTGWGFPQPEQYVQ